MLELLKDDATRPEGAQPNPVPFREDASGRILACARCGHRITTTDSRIVVNGTHEHSFVNPASIRYTIGCFAGAGGCRPIGASSTYWSWFAGHSWQIEQCAACGEHLGWLFRSSAASFHGLILDRLVEIDDSR